MYPGRETDEQRLRRDYYGDIKRQGAAGMALTDSFLTGSSTDPRMAFRESARSAFEDFRKYLARDVRNLRGSQVGMGRLNTGFATQDEDRLVEGAAEDVNRRIAQGALTAEGLNLNRLALIGQHADSYSDRALAARGGEYQTLRQQRLQDEKEHRGGLGSLISGGLTAAANIASGPIGGAIANRWIAPKVKSAIAPKVKSAIA